MFSDDEDVYDYSDYDYSDYEYNAVGPYDNDTNVFCSKIEETPIEQLFRHLTDDDNENFKELLPELIKYKIVTNSQNGTPRSVSEKGDSIQSDNDSDENFMSNENGTQAIKGDVEEIIFSNGETPLMIACGRANPEIVELLIKKGFNVNFKIENTNKNALICLCMSKVITLRRKLNDWNDDALLCLRLLIANNIDPNVKAYINFDDHGNTCLHYAAWNNHWRLIEALVHLNIDVDSMNNQRKTALMLASSRGHFSCCNVLLENGARVSLLMDGSGSTAADVADSSGFHHLSDALDIVSGRAQHNFRLHKLWNQFRESLKDTDNTDEQAQISGLRNYSRDQSLESFCLFLEAPPRILKTLKEQGISIQDLKSMDEENLRELDIPEDICIKIMQTASDMTKPNEKNNSNKISLEFGKPLKPLVLLDMSGDIVSHIMKIDSKLENLLDNIKGKKAVYKEQYQIVNKKTIDEIRKVLIRGEEISAELAEEYAEMERIMRKKLSIEDSSLSPSKKKNNDTFTKFSMSSIVKVCGGSIFIAGVGICVSLWVRRSLL